MSASAPIASRSLLGLWFVVSSVMLAGCTPRPSTDAILLGHIAPFAGPDKALGEQAKQGIDVAVDEINVDPGGGLLNRRVEVLHVNGMGDDNTASDAAVRLITVNRVVGLLGGRTAAEAERLGRAAQTYGLPVATPAGLPSPYPTDNLFPVGLAPEYVGETLARYSKNQLKAKHVVSLSDTRSPFETALTGAFVREFAAGDGRRVEQWTYGNEAALPDLASRVASAAPDSILFAGMESDLLRFRGHLAATEGLKSIVYGGEEPSPSQLLAMRQDRTANRPLFVPTAFAGDGGTELGRAFANKYRERFHQEPTAAAALAYDAARLLFQGVRDAGSTDGTRVRDTLRQLAAFESVTGKISWEGSRLTRPSLFILRLEKGDAEAVQPEAPSR